MSGCSRSASSPSRAPRFLGDRRRLPWAPSLLLSGWRLAVFGDVLPNTFWAKRWPPYAAFGVLDRLTAALELPSFFVVPLAALAILRPARLDLGGLAPERRRALCDRRGIRSWAPSSWVA